MTESNSMLYKATQTSEETKNRSREGQTTHYPYQ